MHTNMIMFLLSIITVFAWSPIFAQTELPPKIVSFIEKLELKKSSLQGGAIAILYKGQVVYKTTFGKKQGDSGSITEDTLFPIASVSKAVSATAIALMVAQGHLKWDDVFTLPYLKNPVNLRNILSHTTGYQFSGNSQIEQGMSRKNLLSTLKNQKTGLKNN